MFCFYLFPPRAHTHSFSVPEITPFTDQLLTNLFSALAIPGSSENEYIMKGDSNSLYHKTKFAVLNLLQLLFVYFLLVYLYVKWLKFAFDLFYSHHAKLLTSPGSHCALHPYTDWPTHSEAPPGQQGKKKKKNHTKTDSQWKSFKSLPTLSSRAAPGSNHGNGDTDRTQISSRPVKGTLPKEDFVLKAGWNIYLVFCF